VSATGSEKIIVRGIEDEMRSAYIDYSMSVIVSRALPDIRDGLKPVHRRVLYGMSELGMASNRPYKKSARIVGEVLGKYHPHGDSSVYDTMVRMAQEWSLRYTLVDGQGNFGSIDGDSAAAMRYTEARLRPLAEELLEDLDKNTVDFGPNFDDSLTEPTVLPAKVPNLLINGSSGIAVGMATNMAPHNLREVCAGTIAYIDNRDITIPELMKHIKAPDFPTGGIIYGYEGVRQAFMTGRGKIILRALAKIETTKSNRTRIVISEVPYQVNKAELHKKIDVLVGEKKIDGITEIRDESDREGIRLVIELRKDANAQVVLNQLYKYTACQVSFSVNNVALVKGRPMTVTLKDCIRYFVDHRHEVVIRRTQYDLDQALARAHILEGLIIALDNLDAVIKLIRSSQNADVAKTGLMTQFGLSEIQAKAILDMRLQRLTSLETAKIRAEYQELLRKIEYYREVLAKEDLRMGIIKDELREVADKYGDNRRTEIVYSSDEFRVEDFIANEDVMITITRAGYIKRTNISEFRKQNRGGTGSKGTQTREEDLVMNLFIASTHNYLLLFTEKGRCYWLKAHEVPEGSRSTKGRHIQNILQIGQDDKVIAYMNIQNLEDETFLDRHSILLCTERGVIKKTPLREFSRPRSSGVTAITIGENDQLLTAALTDTNSEVVMATSAGYAIRFHATDIRDMGRTAAGVRGVRLEEDQKVVGMVVVRHSNAQLLVLSEHGFGKRSSIDEYRTINRGGKGVKTMNITEKTGSLVGIEEVNDGDDLMIITQNGVTIRIAVNDIKQAGRVTMGVRLIKLKDGDQISAMAKVVDSDNDTPVTPLENEPELLDS
jgi:DNA gyrase subunit A